MNREELLDSYKRIKNKIQEIFTAQDEFQKICNQLVAVQKKEEEIRDDVPVGKMGCVAQILGIITGLFMFGKFYNYMNNYEYWPTFHNLFGLLLDTLYFLFGAFLGYTVVFNIHRAMFKSKTEHISGAKADEYHLEFVAPLEKHVGYQKQVIDKLWSSDEIIMYENVIPNDYRTMDALNFFIQSLEKRRADTEKELFNLYEDYLSKQQMIELQNQQLATQIQQLEKQNEQLAATQQSNALNQEQLNKLRELQRNQKKLSSQQRYGNVVSTINLFKK